MSINIKILTELKFKICRSTYKQSKKYTLAESNLRDTLLHR